MMNSSSRPAMLFAYYIVFTAACCGATGKLRGLVRVEQKRKNSQKSTVKLMKYDSSVSRFRRSNYENNAVVETTKAPDSKSKMHTNAPSHDGSAFAPNDIDNIFNHWWPGSEQVRRLWFRQPLSISQKRYRSIFHISGFGLRPLL